MFNTTREKSLAGFLVVLLILTIIITWISQSRISNLVSENTSLVQENYNLKSSNMTLTEKVAALEADAKKEKSVLMEGLLERKLQESGITVEQLKADLLKQQDLIKHKPVLGGTMFFTESGIRILTDKWVIAEFEDGHILGYALIKYKVVNGKINWSIMDSYIFE